MFNINFSGAKKEYLIYFLVFILLTLLAGSEAFFGDPYLYCGLVDQDFFQGKAGLAFDPNLIAHANKYGVLNAAYCFPGVFAKYLLGTSIFSTLLVASWPALIAVLGAIGLMRALSHIRQASNSPWAFPVLVLLSTPLIVYSRNYYSENIQATLLIWAYYFWQKFQTSVAPKQQSYLMKLAIACSLLVLCKLFYLYLGVLIIIALLRHHRKETSKLLCSISIVIFSSLPAIGILLVSNYWKFGSLLGVGYNLERDLYLGFNTPLLTGIYGLILSSGKGLIWYVPALILLPIFLAQDWQAKRKQFWEILSISTPLVLIISGWWAWHGDWSWSPRLIVPLIPLWMLLLGSIDYSQACRRWSVALLTLLGATINFLAVAISPMYYFKLMTRSFESFFAGQGILQDGGILLHYAPDFSPINFQLWLVKCKLSGGACSPDLPWSYLKIREMIPEQLLSPNWDPVLFNSNPLMVISFSVLLILIILYSLGQFVRHSR